MLQAIVGILFYLGNTLCIMIHIAIQYCVYYTAGFAYDILCGIDWLCTIIIYVMIRCRDMKDRDYILAICYKFIYQYHFHCLTYIHVQCLVHIVDDNKELERLAAAELLLYCTLLEKK